MFETRTEVDQLQVLLDRSYAEAGAHLLAIHTPHARVTANQLVARLQGMQIFVLATTTSDCRPRTGPVDFFLYRGQLRFGTSATSFRSRHLAGNPAVSATHVRGEEFVVSVHGEVELLDLERADRDFADFLCSHYGDAHYEQHLLGSPYYSIIAQRMYAADFSI